MLFLHNTSRVADEPYPGLLQEKGFGGFPSLCFMDQDGNVLGKPGRSVAAFDEMHAGLAGLVVLRAKKGRSADEEKELFLLELRLDLVPVGELSARADKLTLSDADKALVSQKLVDGEVAALMQRARELGREGLGERMAALAKAGKVPSDTQRGPFWSLTLQYASQQKDGALADQAFAALEAFYRKQKLPGIERQMETWRKLVEEAKAK